MDSDMFEAFFCSIVRGRSRIPTTFRRPLPLAAPRFQHEGAFDVHCNDRQVNLHRGAD
jgi:hypothetical protein